MPARLGNQELLMFLRFQNVQMVARDKPEISLLIAGQAMCQTVDLLHWTRRSPRQRCVPKQSVGGCQPKRAARFDGNIEIASRRNLLVFYYPLPGFGQLKQ